MLQAIKKPLKINGLEVAGAAGLEPAHDGVKVRCLTAWLRPNLSIVFSNTLPFSRQDSLEPRIQRNLPAKSFHKAAVMLFRELECAKNVTPNLKRSREYTSAALPKGLKNRSSRAVKRAFLSFSKISVDSCVLLGSDSRRTKNLKKEKYRWPGFIC